MGESVKRSSTSGNDTEPLPFSQRKMKSGDEIIDYPPAAATRDSRDEQEDESTSDRDDPYIYSDDSASLSDQYFHPQSDDDLAKPPRYRTAAIGSEYDPLTPKQPSHPSQPQYASWYGAVEGNGERSTSPLWVSGPIKEDSTSMPPFGPEESLIAGDALKQGSGKERRKRKQRQHRAHRKQREQVARERAVTQVRGKPQEVTLWQDYTFAVIFVAQVVIVILCAFRFGFGVISFKEEDLSWSEFKDSKGHFHWQKSRGVSELVHNSSIGDLQYTDDAHKEPLHTSSRTSSTDDYVHQTSSPIVQGVSPDDSFTIDYQNVIALVGISGFYACILAYLTFGFMLILARSLIQIVLIFSVVLALAWGLIGLVIDPYGVISIMAFAAVLLALGYTLFNWNRIPFAATNLYTALCALRCTADITILGLVSLVVAFGWCLVWSMAFIGIVNSFNNADCDKQDECHPHLLIAHIPLYLLLLFSFHWTNMVIKNVVRVTVSSAIGTWWFNPNDISPFCSSAVARPLLQSLTKSLGSICLGSLILQPSQLIMVLGKLCCCVCGSSDSSCTNPHDRRVAPHHSSKPEFIADESAADSVGLCKRPCCGLMDGWGVQLRSCNRFSYTYIGMYGYSFREAGERAYQLFATREWLEIVKDNLIKNVLMIASIVIGGSTGTFAVVVEEMDGYDFTSFHKPIMSAFIVGSVLGFTLSNVIMLGVVGSAVNTVLVCFAAGPFEFEKNHPRLSHEMREAWTHQVWEPPV